MTANDDKRDVNALIDEVIAEPYTNYAYVAQNSAVEEGRAKKHARMLLHMLAKRLASAPSHERESWDENRRVDGSPVLDCGPTRRDGHSALRVKDGKLDRFDPHPESAPSTTPHKSSSFPQDLLDDLVLWTRQVSEQPPERAARGIASAARGFHHRLGEYIGAVSVASATPRINTIPLLKRLREQRDEVANVVREIRTRMQSVHAAGRLGQEIAEKDRAWLAQVDAALAKCPTHEQQLRYIAEGIGMTYEELMAAVNNSADGGKQTDG